MLKVIRDDIDFLSLCSGINQENMRQPLNQSDGKLKAIATWSLAFSRHNVTVSEVFIGSFEDNLFSDWLRFSCMGFGFTRSMSGVSFHAFS